MPESTLFDMPTVVSVPCDASACSAAFQHEQHTRLPGILRARRAAYSAGWTHTSRFIRGGLRIYCPAHRESGDSR